MAQSGSFSNTFSKGFTLKVAWAESNVNVSANTSDLTVTVSLVTASGYYINSTAKKNVSLTVNGTTYTGTCYIGVDKGETVTLFTKTVPSIAHNADGTKSVDISCTVGIKATLNGSYISSASTSGTATLTTIARASQPSCVTWPDHTQNVGSFGDTISIHMNRQSSSFTHTVRYAFGSKSGTIATGVGTGTTWTIPKSFMTLLPNSTSGSGTIYVDTYNGSTLVGTKYCGFTATVPTTDDCYPTCSLVLDDVTGIDDIYGSPVKGLSKIKITVNTTTAYGSPIASCTITANGATYSGTSATTGLLQKSGSSPITATVTDKRGRKCKVAASYTMNVQDYANPSITKLAVNRCDADGTENDSGDNVKVTFSSKVYALNNKNTVNYVLRYKKTSATSWTEVGLSLGTVYTPSNQTHIFAADGNSSYDVELAVTDRHATVQKATSVSTAFTLINFHPSGTGVAFGKVAEKENAFECTLNSEFGKTILPKGDCAIRPISANRPTQGTGGLYTFKATSSMTEGKPPFDAHILGFEWDNTYGFDSQIAVRDSNGALAVRGMDSGVWGNWSNVIDDRGGTITGNTFIKGNATASYFRFNNGWLGMYPTVDDAYNATNRKGWIGFDNGNILNIRDETGGLDYVSKGNQRWAVNGSNVMELTATTLRPIATDAKYMGDATYKWKAVYAVNGTIQTSDRNQKKDIVELGQRYIDLFDRLIPVSFMFNDADSDRTHIGFISQDVEAAMQEVGLTNLDFAGFCKDVKTVWDEEAQADKPVLDEDGNPVYIYSLRYTEFIALNSKMIQMNRETIKAQQGEIDTLKAEMAELKAMLLKKQG